MAQFLSDVKKALREKRKPEVIQASDLLSMGSTRLNLACSGRTTGGIPKGTFCLFAGKSDSGKTWIGLSALAEAANNKNFDGYRLIYVNPERGALMDIGRYFGKRLVNRLEYDEPVYLEDFYDCLDDYFKAGLSYIVLLDSFDALLPRGAEKTYQKQKQARRTGEESKGDYGTEKARINSRNLPKVNSQLVRSRSILIGVSQSRDNIGFGSQYNPETRAGGRALSFYAQMELWFKPKQELRKEVRGKDRQIGTLSEIRVKRTRIKGWRRTVELPIYHSLGVDDVGSCVDYLVEESHWEKGKTGIIKAPEFKFKGPRERLIQKIEKDGSEKTLRILVGETWREIETACEVKRKPRYG